MVQDAQAPPLWLALVVRPPHDPADAEPPSVAIESMWPPLTPGAVDWTFWPAGTLHTQAGVVDEFFAAQYETTTSPAVGTVLVGETKLLADACADFCADMITGVVALVPL